MNTLSTVAIIVAVVLSAFSAFFSVIALGIVRKRNARSVSLRKLCAIEAELLEQADLIVALTTSMKKLRSRITMRQTRAGKQNGAGDIPDPAVDPEGYKRAMRQKLIVPLQTGGK